MLSVGKPGASPFFGKSTKRAKINKLYTKRGQATVPHTPAFVLLAHLTKVKEKIIISNITQIFFLYKLKVFILFVSLVGAARVLHPCPVLYNVPVCPGVADCGP